MCIRDRSTRWWWRSSPPPARARMTPRPEARSAAVAASRTGRRAPGRRRRATDRRHVLVVADRSDELTWKSLRNAPNVHLIAPGQLNTYDVLVSDDVVFTEGAYAAFLAGPPKGRAGASPFGGPAR